jgi:uncharacterized coiled-coil protein SlyX
MSDIALAEINSFAHVAQQADVQPSESIFVLSSGQLREIISQAIVEATEPLVERIEALENRAARQQEDLATLSTTETQDYRANYQDIREIFAAIEELDGKIAKTTPTTATPRGEKTLARIAKIDGILKARGPTTLKELERILSVDRATMTRLLSKLDKRRYEVHSRPGDEREKVLRLKVQIR